MEKEIKKPQSMKKMLIKFISSKGLISFLSSACCILIGLIFGFVLMLALDPGAALKGLGALLSAGASSNYNFAMVLYEATPMMLSGVAIAFCFKLGLFNIGVTGQLTLGAFVGVICGLSGMNWFVCILLSALSGLAVGFVIGLLKSKFNVNEVLSGIMLNWVIYYMIGIIGQIGMPSSFKDKLEPEFLLRLPTNALLPDLGLKEILPGVNLGIIIAIIIIIVLQIILNKTVFGFELKMSGMNREAAKYCGVNQTKAMISAMCIAGACAGIAGYILYANPSYPLKFKFSSNSNTLLGNGFDGISVSLIAQNSPIGCILSAILLSYIESAAPQLKSTSGMYNIHYTELINAIIIYTASFSSFMSMILRKGNLKIIANFSREPLKGDE